MTTFFRLISAGIGKNGSVVIGAILFCSIVGGLLDFLGIAAFIPFINLMLNPDLLNEYVNISIINTIDDNNLRIIFSAAFFCVFLLKNSILFLLLYLQKKLIFLKKKNKYHLLAN